MTPLYVTKILYLIICLSLIVTSLRTRTSNLRITKTILNNYNSASEKEEQWKIQQEMLARRKDPRAREKAAKAVERRRQEAEQQMAKTMWAKNTDPSKDPLAEWKKAKARGDVKDLGYTAAPPKSSSMFGINIPLIQSPIDVPNYDNGQRFDLRLPYAERGYEDEDADVMGKIVKAFGGLFGRKKDAESQRKK